MYLAEKAAACFDAYLSYGHGSAASAAGEFLPRAAGALVLTGAAACLAASSGGGMLPLAPLACGITGSFAVVVLLSLHRRYVRARREHRLFMPLTILPRKWKGKKEDRVNIVLLALAVTLLAVPAVFRVSGTGEWLIPKPHDVPDLNGFSRENLRRLWASGRDKSMPALPNFSDYLCHRAFQKGFFYGYVEELPLPDTKIALPRYREEGGVIKRTEDTLLTFDEIWYNQELERAEKPGIGNLLLCQGIAEISLETAWRVRVDEAWILRYTIIITLGLLLFFLVRAEFFLNFALFMKNFKIGRNQQEA
jgi:hypothetical protein